MDKCCSPGAAALDPAQRIYELDDIIRAIDIKCKSYQYRVKEHALRAVRYRDEEKDVVRYQSEMSLALSMRTMYQKYVGLYTNVVRIRETIDEASSMSEIASHMQLASTQLEGMLRACNPERIDELMDQLEDQHAHMADVAMAITRPLGDSMIMDPESLLAELDQKQPTGTKVAIQTGRVLLTE